MAPTVVEALAALHRGDRAAAIDVLTRPGPSGALQSALLTYLTSDDSTTVYDAPAAFEAFIRGGGNIGLYESVSAVLASQYRHHAVRTLLDLGCGDGRALLPALAAADRDVRVDVVEPSGALLETVIGAAAGAARPMELVPHQTTTQEFAGQLADDEHWDLVESTFSLHTLPVPERVTALRQFRDHTRSLVIVEFDVPDLEPGSATHLEFLARSYETGLTEYEHDGPLVAQGFLMPVLVGQLAPGAVRLTYEQPAQRWAEQVIEAGYRDVRTERLFPYWSSPAFLLTATA